MKFLHIGDLHLGKKFNDISLIDDQKKVINQIIDMANDVECVLIAGDVYDKSSPSNEAFSLFNDFITRLVQNNKRIYIISGNHDADQKISYFSYILKKSNVYVSEAFTGTTQVYTEHDEYGDINIHLLPFIKPNNVKRIYPNEDIQSYEDAIKVVLKYSHIDKSQRNILLCHQYITNAELSDSEELSIGGLDNIDYDVFNDFDYVALGHIHKPQKVGRDTLRYSGSILKYSFSEANHIKSATLLDMKQKNEISIELKKINQIHEVREVRGTYEEIMKMELSLDYIKVILTDEIVPVDCRYEISKVFPNMMKLIVENSKTTDDKNIDIEEYESTSLLDLFKQFYKLQNGDVEPTSEHLKFFEDILNKLEDK